MTGVQTCALPIWALDNRDALARLVEGVDAVIHMAGAVSARNRAAFEKVNTIGTEAVLKAAEAAGVGGFVHVSSLAAREPSLSDYGWSKAASEAAVTASAMEWAIVRPPAVYGPGDREMLELFRMAKRGFVALPPGGRLSVIAAEDLVRLLLDLVETPAPGRTYEPDDGVEGGWSHEGFAHALGTAVGREVRTVAVPARLLRLGAAIDSTLRRGRAKLTRDRARYFCHPDWVVAAERQPPRDLWQAEIPTETGLKATADWYRARKWL